MKTAREMFEELDLLPYKYTDTMWRDILEYSNKRKTTNVKFYLENKLLEVETERGFSYMIDMSLLKAINKQCEELEWLKDSDIK